MSHPQIHWNPLNMSRFKLIYQIQILQILQVLAEKVWGAFSKKQRFTNWRGPKTFGGGGLLIRTWHYVICWFWILHYSLGTVDCLFLSGTVNGPCRICNIRMCKWKLRSCCTVLGVATVFQFKPLAKVPWVVGLMGWLRGLPGKIRTFRLHWQ